MPTIKINQELMRRLKAFKPAFEAVIGEEKEWQDYVEVIVFVGLTKLLMDVMQTPETALAAVLKLAELEPEAVYRLIQVSWEHAEEEQRRQMKQQFGFAAFRPEARQ